MNFIKMKTNHKNGSGGQRQSRGISFVWIQHSQFNGQLPFLVGNYWKWPCLIKFDVWFDILKSIQNSLISNFFYSNFEIIERMLQQQKEYLEQKYLKILIQQNKVGSNSNSNSKSWHHFGIRQGETFVKIPQSILYEFQPDCMIFRSV